MESKVLLAKIFVHRLQLSTKFYAKDGEQILKILHTSCSLSCRNVSIQYNAVWLSNNQPINQDFTSSIQVFLQLQAKI